LINEKVLSHRKNTSANLPFAIANVGDQPTGPTRQPVWLTAKISNNQIGVIASTEEELDASIIISMATSFVNGMMHFFGFVFGEAYEAEINYIICEEENINHPLQTRPSAISERNANRDNHAFFHTAYEKARRSTDSRVRRCIRDLVMALKYPSDSPFYCFRAIESLRLECGDLYKIKAKKDQWEKLREITGHCEEQLKVITKASNENRHGEAKAYTEEQIQEIIFMTWDVVEKFLEKRE
jgi:hypothetical protein